MTVIYPSIQYRDNHIWISLLYIPSLSSVNVMIITLFKCPLIIKKRIIWFYVYLITVVEINIFDIGILFVFKNTFTNINCFLEFKYISV